MSLSARRAWIEIGQPIPGKQARQSLSARRAWIEITRARSRTMRRRVALRKESVDRNTGFVIVCGGSRTVALRKESVDRNVGRIVILSLLLLSLSARRAWIEILVAITPSNFSNGRSPQGERG